MFLNRPRELGSLVYFGVAVLILFVLAGVWRSLPDAFRVELYNVSVSALAEQSGSFLESNNEAKYQPEVVRQLMSKLMAWHSQVSCPWGNVNNSRKGVCKWQEIAFSGCESYPFPGMPVASCRGHQCPAPDGEHGRCDCEPPPDDEALHASFVQNLAM
eukprot:SAG31_NODE_4983_length_2820_cov_1.565968_1_plen_158_part_00